ncbi:hypothetical protein PIB30_055861 [Stylosanthes scabra]|uniref:Uncharacterized protein n=1 Tax=Stylosanthes scabra TaxID=79078 RepID=A0ABU6SJ15_9FABA|nr:hypothetical protein [Stylosanthes scabra]
MLPPSSPPSRAAKNSLSVAGASSKATPFSHHHFHTSKLRHHRDPNSTPHRYRDTLPMPVPATPLTLPLLLFSSVHRAPLPSQSCPVYMVPLIFFILAPSLLASIIACGPFCKFRQPPLLGCSLAVCSLARSPLLLYLAVTTPHTFPILCLIQLLVSMFDVDDACYCTAAVVYDHGWMIREGNAPAKAPTSVVTSFTLGTPVNH